ncbi:MAG: DUF1849 family protein [Pseudomonadota bacterium]
MKSAMTIAILGLMLNTPALSLTPLSLTPHRAYYRVKLFSVKQDSDIADAQGLMVLEMEDVCNGWTIEQNSMTRVQYKSRPAEILRANYAAWESKTGDKLRFNATRTYNNRFKEGVQGQAHFSNRNGRINFNQPERKTLPIQGGTMPPVQHIQSLLAAAHEGETMVSKHVFDGSFYGKPVTINAAIIPKKSVCGVASIKGVDKMAWPLRLAVFSSDGESSLPSFEIQQMMTDQGIMCTYRVDFGEYILEGTLEKVEFMPESACQNP